MAAPPLTATSILQVNGEDMKREMEKGLDEE